LFPYRKETFTQINPPQIWDPALQLTDIRFINMVNRLNISPPVTLRIEHINPYQQKSNLLIKSRCAFDTAAVIRYMGTCDIVYIQQNEVHGSIITENLISLGNYQEKDWNINLEGSHFYYPFDRYTAVLHVRGTEIFLPEGELLKFKYTVSTDWIPKGLTPQHGRDKTSDLKAIVTIRFWRPWCLWLLAFSLLGGGGALSIFGSWVYRHSIQEYLALAAFPIAFLALRDAVFNHVPAPTMFGMVVGGTFILCILIQFFAPPPHSRIRTH
jgi:hypothetical protein